MKRTILISLGVLFGLSIVAYGGQQVLAASNDSNTTLYRVYNPNSGEHFYTESANERDNLVKQGWTNENDAWQVPVKGDIVYRLYNSNAGDHFYTKSESEYNWLGKKGWTQEGQAFLSDTAKKVPVYRDYNPNATSGAHFYTTSLSEHNGLDKLGWVNEEVAFYATSNSSSETVVNKDILNTLIKKVENTESSNYTAASFADFQTALAAAKKVSAEEKATQVEVDAATTNLQNTFNNLEKVAVVDKAELAAKITAAKAIKGDDYTEASYAALQAKIDASETILNNSDATQAEVNEQVTALQTAIDQLAEKPLDPAVVPVNTTISKLTDLSNQPNSSFVASSYTVSSWNKYSAALTAAQNLINASKTGAVTNDSAEKVNTDLQTAFNQLQFIKNLNTMFAYGKSLTINSSAISDEMKKEVNDNGKETTVLAYVQNYIQSAYNGYFVTNGDGVDFAAFLSDINPADIVKVEDFIKNNFIENETYTITDGKGESVTVSAPLLKDASELESKLVTAPTIDWNK
ncbi:hypothetical protein [Enterococcus alishanensis]